MSPTIFLLPVRSRSSRGTTLAAMLLAGLIVCLLAPVAILACGGGPPRPTWSQSTVLVKTAPAVFPVAGAAGPTPAVIPTTVFIGALGSAPGPACTPVTTTVTLTLACVPPPPGPAPAVVGAIAVATPVIGPYAVAVPIMIPAGPPRICFLAGTATTTWADGSTSTGAGDIEICIVDPAPGEPIGGTPRLDLELLTPSTQTAHPGDQRTHRYRLTNNDPSEYCIVDITADSEQTARLPLGSPQPPGSGSGVYAISDPGTGDNFPITFIEDLPPPPIPPVEYEVGDGTAEAETGSTGAIIWLNQFDVLAGAAVIDEISVTYGTVTNGTPALVGLYDDPDDDGNPDDAVLLTSSHTTAQSGATVDVRIQPTPAGTPGDSFFVGVIIQDVPLGDTPAALDTSSLPENQSWVAATLNDCQVNAADLAQLLFAPVPAVGNWVLAANGRPSVGLLGWIELPPDPTAFGVPQIGKTIRLCPGESTEIEIAMRSWPMCRPGSACEQRLKAVGSFSNGDPALACAAAGMLLDLVPPDFQCPDGGAHTFVNPQGPDGLQYDGQMPSHQVLQGAHVVSTQVTGQGGPLPPQVPISSVLDPVVGRIAIDNPGPLFVGQPFGVELEIRIDTKLPGFQSELVDLQLHSASPIAGETYFFGTARAQLSGGTIPPSLDTFFDYFFHVSVDGLTAGLHHAADIDQGSINGQIVAPDRFGLAFQGVFQNDPQLPPNLDIVTVHVDASGIAHGVQLAPPCPWDCEAAPDGNIGINDFLAVLAQWTQIGTSCDFDGGGVGINEFLDILANWGPCP